MNYVWKKNAITLNYSIRSKPVLKSDSHLSKNFVICFIESPLKMMKNAFLFHLKSSFRSQDI